MGGALRYAITAACAGLVVVPAIAGPLPSPGDFAGFAPDLVVRAQSTQARAVQAVNVRTGPGAQFGVVGVLRGGEVVGLAGCDAYWCQLADGRGWVSRQYLSIGGAPAAIGSLSGGTVAPAAPASMPARFTGAWYVVASAIEPPRTPHSGSVDRVPPPVTLPPFQLLLAQAGTTVEGIADGRRLEGTVDPGGLDARIAMTTAAGEQLAGELRVDDAGNSMAAVMRAANGVPKFVWRATRTMLTN